MLEHYLFKILGSAELSNEMFRELEILDVEPEGTL